MSLFCSCFLADPLNKSHPINMKVHEGHRWGTRDWLPVACLQEPSIPTLVSRDSTLHHSFFPRASKVTAADSGGLCAT